MVYKKRAVRRLCVYEASRAKSMPRLSPKRFKKKRFSSLKNAHNALPVLYFSGGWIALFAVVLFDTLWESRTWLTLPSPWIALKLPLYFVILKLLYCRFLDPHIPWIRLHFSSDAKRLLENRIFLGTEYLVLAHSISGAACIFTYLACTLPYPLIDPSLQHIDQLIGFDWRVWFDWSSRPWIYSLLKTGYYSLFFQTIFFVSWFSCWSDKNRLYEIFWILFLGVMASAVISGFWPAVGPVFAFDQARSLFDHLQPLGQKIFAQVTSIKMGSNPDFKSQGLTGIITFPSFHTICALVFMYGFRGTGFIGYGICLLNILVLLSIPFIGNHYLVDMGAGGILAVLCILAVRISTRKTKSSCMF